MLWRFRRALEQLYSHAVTGPYPALAWSVCVPGHHGYPRAPDLILRKALRGRLGHQITGATARPFLHLLHPTRRPRQVNLCIPRCVRDQPWTSPRRVPNTLILRHSRLNARIVAATLRQHSPSDPRQLIGECRCQNVMMQALPRSLEPQPKIMFRPVCWSEQNNAGLVQRHHAQES